MDVVDGCDSTRNPQWVLEHVNRHTVQGDADRGGSRFKEDTSIAPHLRNRLDDFKDSGYDRGHLTPAADHKNSQRAMDQSFSLSNVSPQVRRRENPPHTPVAAATIRCADTRSFHHSPRAPCAQPCGHRTVTTGK
jgi:hypothetical protein